MSSLPQDPDNTDWPDSGSELSRQDLGRLIYASICQVDGPVLDEMRRIREHAVVNNQAHNIRVALMHRCGWFVEWIEGPPDGIRALMERVALDPRHRSLRVVHESVGKPRLFKPWIGSIAEATEGTGEFARRVVVHRRFAGAARDALDVESDYLDLPQQAAAGRRLIANARKGLAMGMTHAFLPDYAALVIVLDTDPERNEHLLDRLLTACQHVAHQPVIVGLGADSWFSDSLRSTTEARGLRWVEARTGDRAHDMATLWWALKRVLDALT